MAGESVTVTTETAAQANAEASAAAAQLANTAAQAAIHSAEQLASQSARAAENAVTAIAETTAEELAEQESELAWLREHAESFGAHRANVERELPEMRQEINSLKSSTQEIMTGVQALLKSLTPQARETESVITETAIVTPPEQPNEGAAPPVPETRRKRRLI